MVSTTPFATIQGNSISAVNDAARQYWDGIEFASIQGTVSQAAENNTIDGSAAAPACHPNRWLRHLEHPHEAQ